MNNTEPNTDDLSSIVQPIKDRIVAHIKHCAYMDDATSVEAIERVIREALSDLSMHVWVPQTANGNIAGTSAYPSRAVCEALSPTSPSSCRLTIVTPEVARKYIKESALSKLSAVEREVLGLRWEDPVARPTKNPTGGTACSGCGWKCCEFDLMEVTLLEDFEPEDTESTLRAGTVHRLFEDCREEAKYERVIPRCIDCGSTDDVQQVKLNKTFDGRHTPNIGGLILAGSVIALCAECRERAQYQKLKTEPQ